MAKHTAGGTPATLALTRAGVAFTLHAYQHDPRSASFGMEAADALGVAPERVFKTLLARVDRPASSGQRPELVVGIVPVDARLDLKSLARALGGNRAEMAEPAAAERATGYVVGGISPFGQKRPHPTMLDASALQHETILVSAGRRGLDLEIAPADLVRLLGATTARIGRR